MPKSKLGRIVRSNTFQPIKYQSAKEDVHRVKSGIPIVALNLNESYEPRQCLNTYQASNLWGTYACVTRSSNIRYCLILSVHLPSTIFC